ncbi:MAG: ABC transporter permease [Caldilineaceae bacterium]|nr:ABC transporter permease [Caldilineaceae bacterium]
MNTRLFFAKLIDVLLPVLAMVIALLVGVLLLLLLGTDPFEAYSALIQGALGNVSGITQTLTKATPLLLVGLGICIAFRGGVINIGGEGQIVVGALAATAFGVGFGNLPALILLPLTLISGAAAGLIWGGIPGLLKARLGVNEILTTVMMNQIALRLMNFLLRGPMLDPEHVAAGTSIPQSAALPESIWLTRLVPRTLFHSGAILAVLLALAVYFLLWRTTIGYRIRAVGLNPHASRYAGIPVPKYVTLSLALSGMLCGLAGAVEVLGVHHRMLEGLSGGYGFSGIVAALFGKLHPLGAIPASALFGALLVGADKMQRAVQVPSALAIALQGLVVLFVVSSDLYVRRRTRRRVGEDGSDGPPAAEGERREEGEEERDPAQLAKGEEGTIQAG